MSARKLVVVAPLRSMRLPVASAQIPSPTAEPIQERLNAAEGQLTQKALRLSPGGGQLDPGIPANGAERHRGRTKSWRPCKPRLRHELNAAGEQIEKKVNAASHGLVNKAAQRPGLEALLAVAGVVASASVLRNRD